MMGIMHNMFFLSFFFFSFVKCFVEIILADFQAGAWDDCLVMLESLANKLGKHCERNRWFSSPKGTALSAGQLRN